jgi:hypothetical protein
MNDAGDIFVQAILWAAWLAGLYAMWKFRKYFKPSLSFKGWGTLQSEFGIGDADLPASVRMLGTEVRVGIYKTDLAKIGLDDNFVYLDRPLSSSVNGILRIPFQRIALVSAPSQTGGIFHLPVAGIFKVDGVELWLGSPHAEQIIARLN